MTVTLPGIGSAASRPSTREAPSGYKEGRAIESAAAQIRPNGSRAIDAALLRLRRFLESGDQPERFALPGTYLNILI
jgi:hypothetical protein